MRNLIWMLMLSASTLFCQEETLIGGKIEHGGFGGPVVKVGSFMDETGIFVGGRGGWIINHRLALGGGGYGLANEIPVEGTDPQDARRYAYDFGYGGFVIEWIAASKRLVHMTVECLVGGGGISLRDRDIDRGGCGCWETNEWDHFFVLEPGVNLEINVTTFFRVCFGGHYRFVSDLDFRDVTASKVSGPMAAITLKFGRF